MGRPLRLLIVEDSSDDAELMLLALRRGGFDPTWTRVETADELRVALTAGSWDAVLSDYTIPAFGAAVALGIVREFDPDLPFLVISGTVGEELAVAMMRAGANDYILKSNLTRLAPALIREVRHADHRRARRVAELQSRQLAALVNSSEDAIFSMDLKGQILFWNRAAERLLGYAAADVIGQSAYQLVPPELLAESRARVERVRNGEHLPPFETVRLRKDGTTVPVSVSISAVWADNRVVALSGIYRDISERKRGERERQLLLSIIEYTPDFVGIAHVDERVVFVNRAGQNMVGLRGGAEVGRTSITDYFPGADREQMTEEVLPTLRARGHVSGEVAFRHFQTGALIPTEWNAFAVPDPDTGSPAYFACVAHDITDRKRAEENLRRTSDLLTAVAEGATDAVFVKDRAGRYLLCNAAAAGFVGRASAEMLGRTDAELFDAPSARLIESGDRLVMETGHAVTREEELTAGGITRTFLATKAPYRDAAGNVAGVIGISRDITDRKQVEKALRENEARLAEAVRAARLGYWSRDLTTGVIEWSDKLYEIFGLAPEDFDGTFGAFLATLHPDDRPRVEARIAEAVATAGQFEHTYRILVRGEVRVILEIGCVIPSPEGTPVRLSGTAQDITERVRAEEALRLRDRAMQAVTQGIVICDATATDCPIIYAGPGFERLTGYTSEEILGRNCRFLQGTNTDPAAIAQLRAAVQAGEPRTIEILNYRKDGAAFWNELSISPVRDHDGRLTHFIGVQVDVTARRKLEEQFRQAQKMEAVGQLAGGVAHDFNNLLTIINGYSDLLLQERSPGDPSWELLAEIHKAGERSAGLTRQLLAFSRQQIVTLRVLNLNEVVADTEKMLRRLIGEDIRLVTTLAPGLWPVRSDPGQVEQVLLNLAINARDAMPQGGRLTIETSNVELDEGYGRSHPDARIGPHVLLRVTDTGCGMRPEVRARIFEPFFTTKDPGKGTGLGLATVYGIVRQSGGHITVESEVGDGTTFEVYLPRTENTEGSKFRSGLLVPPRGTETILLVEDEAGVRTLTRHVLNGCGYRVLEAADGDEAVRVASGHTEAIHLLITDVVMPGIGGRVVAERITERHPEARVLFVSGYTDDAILRHGVSRELVHFLPKPYSPLVLACKTRELLDAQA